MLFFIGCCSRLHQYVETAKIQNRGVLLMIRTLFAFLMAWFVVAVAMYAYWVAGVKEKVAIIKIIAYAFFTALLTGLFLMGFVFIFD